MSKYARNEGETPAQFNARINASEKAEAERRASMKPRVRNEVAEQQLGQAQPALLGRGNFGPESPARKRLEARRAEMASRKVARDARRGISPRGSGPNDGPVPTPGSIKGMPRAVDPPMDQRREQMMRGIQGAGQGESPMGGNPLGGGSRTAGSPAFQQTAMQLLRPGQPIAKGGVVKKAAGGAAKVRKGMMTSEGVITNAMNKVRGK